MDAEEYGVNADYYYSGETNCPVCTTSSTAGRWAMAREGASVISHRNPAYSSASNNRIVEGRLQPAVDRVNVNQWNTNSGTPSFTVIQNIPEWRAQPRRLKDWCKCSHCGARNKNVENVCCMEFPDAKAKLDEISSTSPNLTCITDHPAFHSLCLDPWVIQRSWLQHKQQYRELSFSGQQADKYREIAKHQFVMWYWGYLTHNANRLPNCVFTAIDKAFTKVIIEQKSMPKLQ